MTTIIKIGTESLSGFETSEKVNTLVRDISHLMHTYQEKILLVTSGAVGFGRKLRPEITDKHILAAIGTAPLFSAYDNKFREHDIMTGTILATHADIEDFEKRRQQLQLTISGMWENNILPIVNENDAVSAEEMNEVPRGADNDQNALLLAKIFHAKNLMIISNTDGVLADRNNPNSTIPILYADEITQE